MALVRSIVFSILASVLATLAARLILSVSQPSEGEDGRESTGNRAIVVVVPILAGNSNNRIGYVKEIRPHHRPHHRPRLGRAWR